MSMSGKRRLLGRFFMTTAFCLIHCINVCAMENNDIRNTGIWLWKLHPDGYAIITGCAYWNARGWDQYGIASDIWGRYEVNEEEPLIVPTELDGYPVKELASDSFFMVGFKHIVLPEGLTTIRKWAFSEGCIETISIPSTVTTIEHRAFSSCIFLNCFELAAGNTSFQLIDNMLVTADGKELVSCPAGLGEDGLVVPDGIEVLRGEAFSPAFIGEMTLPESLTTICDHAFYAPYGPLSIDIPADIQRIEDNAFARMSGDVTFHTLPQFMGKNVFQLDRVDFWFTFLPDVEMPIRFSSQEAIERFFETGKLESSMLQPKPEPAPEQPVEDPPQDTPQIPPRLQKRNKPHRPNLPSQLPRKTLPLPQTTPRPGGMCSAPLSSCLSEQAHT